MPRRHGQHHRVVRAVRRGCEPPRRGRAGPRVLTTLRLRRVCPARRAASRARTRRRRTHGRGRGDRPPQHRRRRRFVRAGGRGCERPRRGRAGPRVPTTLRLRRVCRARRAASRARTRRREPTVVGTAIGRRGTGDVAALFEQQAEVVSRGGMALLVGARQATLRLRPAGPGQRAGWQARTRRPHRPAHRRDHTLPRNQSSGLTDRPRCANRNPAIKGSAPLEYRVLVRMFPCRGIPPGTRETLRSPNRTHAPIQSRGA